MKKKKLKFVSLVSLLNILEIETKGPTGPVLPVEHKKDTSEKTWGQIVLWSPPKLENNLPNAPVAVNFEEAGASKTRYRLSSGFS